MPTPPLTTIARQFAPHLPQGTTLLWGSEGQRTAINWIMASLSLCITMGLGYWLLSSILYWSSHPFTGWSLLALVGIFVLWSISWGFAYLCWNDWYQITRTLVGASATHLYHYNKDKPLNVWTWEELPPLLAHISKSNFMNLVYQDQEADQAEWLTIARKIKGDLDDYLALQKLQKTVHEAQGLYAEVYEFYQQNSAPPADSATDEPPSQ